MECTMRGEQLCTQTAELTARKLLLFVCTKPIENVHVLYIYIYYTCAVCIYIYTYVLIYVRILYINTYKCRRDYLWQPIASRHRSSVGRPRVQAYWHRAYFRARANHNLQKAYCQKPFENVKSILILTRLTLKKFERNRTIEVHFPLVILHTDTEHAREHVSTKPLRLRVPIVGEIWWNPSSLPRITGKGCQEAVPEPKASQRKEPIQVLSMFPTRATKDVFI